LEGETTADVLLERHGYYLSVNLSKIMSKGQKLVLDEDRNATTIKSVSQTAESNSYAFEVDEKKVLAKEKMDMSNLKLNAVQKETSPLDSSYVKVSNNSHSVFMPQSGKDDLKQQEDKYLQPNDHPLSNQVK
jgi:hypothetical protein